MHASLPAIALAMILAPATPAAFAHGGNVHKPAAAQTLEQTPWGMAGDPAAARRTMNIRMTDDMRFTPDRIRVKRGETVRFVLRNDGRMLHEMVIGTRATLEEHAALMRKFPDMEHDEAYMAHVPPGATGEIIWHFNRAGDFEYACLIPGHYEAGMRGTIRVLP